MCQIPCGIADRELAHVAQPCGDLEADAVESDGPVAAALAASDVRGERETELVGRGALPRHRGALEPTCEWHLAGLGMDLMVIVQLDPCLCGLIEQCQGQIGLALEHWQEATFHRVPERLLFAVLIGTVRKRGLMNDGKARQSFGRFSGDHGRAVVGEKSTWQSPLHERLHEAMHQTRSRFVEIPLRVTDKPGAVVQNGQQDRSDPLAVRQQHLERSVMEVEVPQTAHVLALVTANFTRRGVFPGSDLAGPLGSRLAPLTEQTVRDHEAMQRRVRRRRAQVGIVLDLRGQVVQVQLVAPRRVLLMLPADGLGQLVRHRQELSAVTAKLPLQYGDRVPGRPCRVVPALDGRDAEVHHLTSRGMPPRQTGQAYELGTQFSRGRR